MSDAEIFGKDSVHEWRTKSICRHMLYEGCDLRGHLGIVGSTYREHFNKRKNKNFKDEAFRNHAIQVMSEFYDYMSTDIDIWPMFGTLLGMVRDDDLIKHDDDIDFGYLKRDEYVLISMSMKSLKRVISCSKDIELFTILKMRRCSQWERLSLEEKRLNL